MAKPTNHASVYKGTPPLSFPNTPPPKPSKTTTQQLLPKPSLQGWVSAFKTWIGR